MHERIHDYYIKEQVGTAASHEIYLRGTCLLRDFILADLWKAIYLHDNKFYRLYIRSDGTNVVITSCGLVTDLYTVACYILWNLR